MWCGFFFCSTANWFSLIFILIDDVEAHKKFIIIWNRGASKFKLTHALHQNVSDLFKIKFPFHNSPWFSIKQTRASLGKKMKPNNYPKLLIHFSQSIFSSHFRHNQIKFSVARAKKKKRKTCEKFIQSSFYILTLNF